METPTTEDPGHKPVTRAELEAITKRLQEIIKDPSLHLRISANLDTASLMITRAATMLPP